MSQSFDLVVRGGRCFVDGALREMNVGVRAGKVAELGVASNASAGEVLDVAGAVVLPGVIDPQVHFREPGHPHKEDLASGTRAAVLGGVTTVFEMPNTLPPTTSAAAHADKFRRADGRVWCDVGFFVGAKPENAEELAELERLPGCVGVKVFMGKSTGNLLVDRDEDLRRVLASGTRRVAVHAEDEARLEERAALLGAGGDVSLHPVWRDVETALRATRRIVGLAREAGRPIHVLHVTTAEEIEFLAEQKAQAGSDLITAECTPQHLTLSAPDCYERLGTLAQMNPPIREARHRDGLWRGVESGVIDAIGSDHAPHALYEKARPHPQSPSGMTGVQTLVPVMLDHVANGRLDLARFVEICCSGPARIYAAKGKGAIAEGFDADFSIVDLAAERVIENRWIASRCGWTPFAGTRVKGWPVATVVRGRVVMRDAEVIGPALGRPVAF